MMKRSFPTHDLLASPISNPGKAPAGSWAIDEDGDYWHFPTEASDVAVQFRPSSGNSFMATKADWEHIQLTIFPAGTKITFTLTETG